MAKTIIQTIGPLYGEVVNGTVFGRPNGSIFVPLSNKVTISLPSAYIKKNRNFAVPCNAAGSQISNNTVVVAESQDVANKLTTEIATDSDFTDLIASGSWTAGIFNIRQSAISALLDDIENGTTYYVRAQLVTQSNVAVATSEVIEVTGVVPS